MISRRRARGYAETPFVKRLSHSFVRSFDLNSYRFLDESAAQVE
jgi:hypothetical protein